ncbi:transposase [Streptomyces sp. BE133]|uniref:transposase n=1 Tax=Streptomyces sp. BE133 TaxID=3002523 RepID=UPI002E79FC73|nr:transposase [Streptomyces sp. BE133]MEE1805705.1 transposase [Streptomyces sp. BE133]
MPAPRKYPLELRERAVRMYRTAEPKPVIRRMAEELGVHHEALRNWIRQAEADAGERDDLLTTAEREELAALRDAREDTTVHQQVAQVGDGSPGCLLVQPARAGRRPGAADQALDAHGAVDDWRRSRSRPRGPSAPAAAGRLLHLDPAAVAVDLATRVLDDAPGLPRT